MSNFRMYFLFVTLKLLFKKKILGQDIDLVVDDFVADLGQEYGELNLDLLVACLSVADTLVVHLVDAHDHLLHTEGESKESVLASLAALGVAGLELTDTRSNLRLINYKNKKPWSRY